MKNIFISNDVFCQPIFKETKQYIENGGDINVQNKHGNTALIHASIRGRTETARLLLAHGANIKTKNKDGNTALMHASARKHIETAYLLKKATKNTIF